MTPQSGRIAAEVPRGEAERLAARLPALTVGALRLATTVAQGVHGRRRVGPGTSFWQFRPYEVGDSIQRIDWRRSAKAGPLYVREREWEASARVWLWRDLSPSMSYRSSPHLPTKGERADLLLLALAALLVRGEEHVAFLGANARPSGGNFGLDSVTHALAAALVSGSADAIPPPQTLPRYAEAVIFGDFLAPLPALEARIRKYAQRGAHLHLLQILDPAEETLPFAGRVHFHGSENEGDVLVNRTETVRESYYRRLTAHRAGLAEAVRRIGGTFQTHRTDRGPETALLALYGTLAALPAPEA